MSSYDSPAHPAGGTAPWAAFGTSAFESETFPQKTASGSFVALHSEAGRDGEFIPLGGEKDGPEQRDPNGKAFVQGAKKVEKKVEEILDEARRKAEHLEQEGYEKGFSQGEKDGLELGKKRAAKLTENIERLLLEMSRSREELTRRHEKEILRLVFAIVGKVTGRYVREDDRIIRETVVKALRLAVDRTRVSIRIHPGDRDCLENLRPELMAKFRDLASITLVPDPSVSRGGCLLETPCGEVDARIETQLENIFKDLAKAVPPTFSGETAPAGRSSGTDASVSVD